MPSLADKPDGGSRIPLQKCRRNRSSYVALELLLIGEQRRAQAEGERHSLMFICFSGVLEDAGEDFSWKLVQVHAMLDSKSVSEGGVYFFVCAVLGYGW